MRAYHTGVDFWTVLDDNSGEEWQVSAPDREGKRTVTTRDGAKATNRVSVIQRVLAAVEKRSAEMATDWTDAHR